MPDFFTLELGPHSSAAWGATATSLIPKDLALGADFVFEQYREGVADRAAEESSRAAAAEQGGGRARDGRQRRGGWRRSTRRGPGRGQGGGGGFWAGCLRRSVLRRCSGLRRRRQRRGSLRWRPQPPATADSAKDAGRGCSRFPSPTAWPT